MARMSDDGQTAIAYKAVTPDADFDRPTIRLSDGTNIWASVSGTGPPVVFLHGGPGLWDYLGSLAALVDDTFTVVRFDQRGCGRSDGDGPFTIAQAVDDLDQIRTALGFGQWAIAGHSWGAELAIRYAARHPDRTTAVAYIAGVGAGNGFRDGHRAEISRRLGPGLERLRELDAILASDRTLAQERERCLLQWSTDFSPGPAAIEHARALWDTKPPGAAINETANRQLWGDRETEDLCVAAARVTCPVTMLCGADDPRPWTATGSLLDALADARRIVFDHAGHAPWAERPADTRRVIIDAVRRRSGESRR
jgi:proline iminopeptidase